MIDLSMAFEASNWKLSAQALVSKGRRQSVEMAEGYSEVYRINIQSSSKSRQSTVSATPMDKSFPVEQANKIFGGLSLMVRDLRNGRSKGS